MNRERLLTLLANLGQSSPEGLSWLAGEGQPGGRALFLVPLEALQAALAASSKPAKGVEPFEAEHFFYLVATDSGAVLSLDEVRELKAPKGKGLLITLEGLAPLTSRQQEKIAGWESLTRSQQDRLFDGPLSQIVRLSRHDKQGEAGASTLAGGLGASMAAAVEPQLDTSVADIEATAEQLGINPAEEPGVSGQKGVVDGTGVIMGIVDFGCDFAHPNFRSADGATRLLSLWDQNEGGGRSALEGPGGRSGRVYSRAEIDWALDPGHHPCPEIGKAKGEPPPYVEAADHPYWRLGYDPHARHYIDVEALGGAHGTHVMDIAAGNGYAVVSGPPRNAGVAPGADLVFVQLAKESGPRPGAALDQARLLMGVLYIFKEAAQHGRPAVVNISLNGNAGPHDGRATFDQVLDWLLTLPGRCITVAAGNFREQSCHARRVVQSGDQTRFTWLFPPGDRTQNRVQFWTDSATAEIALSAKIKEGGGLSLPLSFRLQHLVPPGDKPQDEIRLPFGTRAQVWLPSSSEAVLNDDESEIGPPHRTRVGFASIRAIAAPGQTSSGQTSSGQTKGAGRRLLVSLWLEPQRIRDVLARHRDEDHGAKPHPASLELTLATSPGGGKAEPLVIDGWIERDDFRIDETGSNQGDQSRFEHAQEMHSLGSLSCGRDTVVVGAYYDTAEDRALWHHSSLGPTRIGGSKPDVSAPGRLIHAARSKGFRQRYPGSESPWRTAATIAFSGTSMAAPHVAGIAALLLQIRPDLTGAEIGRLLRESVQEGGPGRRWHHGFGCGRVSAARTLAKALARREGGGAGA